MFYLIIFLSQLFLIYLLGKRVIQNLFNLLSLFIKDEKKIYLIISLIYLPGTIIHESSHLLAATALLLKVKSIKFIPEYHPGAVKLGSISYERKDFIRGFIVGIAPLFGALLFFYFIATRRPFPSDNMYIDLILIYLIFTISSTMFSSKQDLVDFIYILPTLFIAAGLIYIFQVDIHILVKNETAINNMLQFIKEINFYLFLALLTNCFIIIILRSVLNLLKR